MDIRCQMYCKTNLLCVGWQANEDRSVCVCVWITSIWQGKREKRFCLSRCTECTEGVGFERDTWEEFVCFCDVLWIYLTDIDIMLWHLSMWHAWPHHMWERLLKIYARLNDLMMYFMIHPLSAPYYLLEGDWVWQKVVRQHIPFITRLKHHLPTCLYQCSYFYHCKVNSEVRLRCEESGLIAIVICAGESRCPLISSVFLYKSTLEMDL